MSRYPHNPKENNNHLYTLRSWQCEDVDLDAIARGQEPCLTLQVERGRWSHVFAQNLAWKDYPSNPNDAELAQFREDIKKDV